MDKYSVEQFKKELHTQNNVRLIRWNPNEEELNFTEILIWFFLFLFFTLSLTGIMGLHLMILTFLLPIGRVTYDWGRKMPITARIESAFSSLRPSQAGVFAFLILLILLIFEIIVLLFLKFSLGL